MKKRWQLIIGILISAAFLFLALRSLKLEEVWNDLLEADYWWILPGVAVYVVGVWFRTWRWDYMLRPLKHVSLRRLFPVVIIGYMGNNIYPLRAGEVLRSYVLRRREDIPMSASLATVIVERVFDGLVMLAFVFIGLPFAEFSDDDGLVRLVVIVFSIVFFVALVVFFGLAAMPQRTRRLMERLTGRFLPEQYHARTMEITDRFLEGLISLRSFRNVMMIFWTSVLIWLLETVKYWFVMQAFDFDVSFFALMLMNGVVNLATTVPSAPGYLGTFDVPGIYVLNELYGVNINTAGAYTLVLHAALWLVMTVPGIVLMVREGLKWSDFDRAVEAAEGQPLA